MFLIAFEHRVAGAEQHIVWRINSLGSRSKIVGNKF
jgi:hypothetical protein